MTSRFLLIALAASAALTAPLSSHAAADSIISASKASDTQANLVLMADGSDAMPGMDMSGGNNGEAAPADHPEMQAVKAGSLSLEHGYLKGMLPGQAVAGGSVSITNGGSEDDRLVSVSSPVADHVEIHEMTMENDIMKMRQLKGGLAVPAGQTVALTAGGMHLMFMGVKTPVRTGQSVQVTFTFEKAGSVDAVLPVVDPRKAGGGGHKHN